MYGEKLNGKLVDYFITIDKNGFTTQYCYSHPDNKLVYEFEYRGEYSIGWIVEYDYNSGHEIARVNDKYVVDIHWKVCE